MAVQVAAFPSDTLSREQYLCHLDRLREGWKQGDGIIRRISSSPSVLFGVKKTPFFTQHGSESEC